MNILYINHYAGGPSFGMEFRPFFLGREWVRAGHRVRILAASYSHVRASQPLAPSRASPSWREFHDGVEYVWYQTPAYTANDVGRVRNIAAFLYRVARDARRIVEEFAPELVIASSTYPMDIWAARRIAGKANARLIFELHDLWPLSLVELGDMSPRHPFVHLCGMAEKAAYRGADTVISMLPKVGQHAATFGVSPERLHIVPNGVSPEDWDVPAAALRPDLAEFVESQQRCGRLVVGYTGAHGLPNALDVLIDAAALVGDQPFAFAIVGEGMEKQSLASRLAATQNDRVRMFAPISKAQVQTFLQKIDIAYLGLRPSPLFRFGIAPNKLLDYMMAGLPVLQSVDAGNDIVTEARCGLTVRPGSPEAVAEGLRRLASLSIDVRQEMGRRGRQYVLENHSYPVLARRFLVACA